MTDLIYPPFTLHDITVGPNLEAAQLGPNSTGLYVETLQTWLTALGCNLENYSFGTFDNSTREAVRLLQQDAHLPVTGVVTERLWKHLQQELSVGAKAILPPDPDRDRQHHPFPNPKRSDFEKTLLEGLEYFGVYSPSEPSRRDEALRLFKALARDSSSINTKEPAKLEDTRFWSQQWQRFQPTWGRLIGAPWLGVIVKGSGAPAANIWGSRPLIREILQAGHAYLLSSTDATDLHHRLANPIAIRWINPRYGYSDKDHYGHSFAIELSNASDTDIGFAWLLALSHTSPHLLQTPNPALRAAFNKKHDVTPLNPRHLLPFVTRDAVPIAGPHTLIKWVREHSSNNRTYDALEEAWPTMLPGKASSEAREVLNTRRRLNIAIGAHLPYGFRYSLPEEAFALVNGYVGSVATPSGQDLVACAALITCGMDPANFSVTSNHDISPAIRFLDSFLSAFPPENEAFFKALQHSGYTCTFLIARGLSHGTRYTYEIKRTPSATHPLSTWSFDTPPATIDYHGLSFLAASCYCDFSALGSFATPAGDTYLSATTKWLNYTKTALQSFFHPEFRVLCGDNIYLDVAPDFLFTDASRLTREAYLFRKRHISGERPPLLLESASSTLGKYIRYMSLSGYAKHLSELPSIAIPDDHEYWNDYNRKQYHAERSRSDYHIHAATSRDAYRLFQGAMTPAIAKALAYPESAPPSSAPPISKMCQSISIGTNNSSQLSIFLLDTTSTRTYKYRFPGKERDDPERLFADDVSASLIKWINDLTCPGIIVTGQPIAIPKEFRSNKFFNLPVADYHASAFKNQFSYILDAISSSPWDIAIVTGDVHWSRLISMDATDVSSVYAASLSGFPSSAHRKHQPTLHEIISSPAQRLATESALLNQSYNKPDYDYPGQIFTTGPWTTSDRDYDKPQGPRVTSATYESPTFASFRIQPIHKHASRLDVAFCNSDGRIAQRDAEQDRTDKQPLSSDPRDLAHTSVRWLVPNEWVTVDKVPVSLWTSFDIGAAGSPENARPHYPYGSHDTYNGQGPDHAARLPPITDSGQFVRALKKGEKLLVKRVLYQAVRARRGQTVEREYQCVEVATMNPMTAGRDGMLDECYFVWSIYNGDNYLSPINEHLYSMVLRKRLPWFETGDRIVTLLEDGELWDPTHVSWPEGIDNKYKRFEWGHIARAPLTSRYLQKLSKGVEAVVQRVYYQAEQAYIASEHRLDGAYQLLEIKIETTGDEGLYWSVYDSKYWAEISGQASVPKVKREELRIGANLHWIRSTAGPSSWALRIARYLELFQGEASRVGSELRLYRGAVLPTQEQSGAAVLYAWATASPLTLVSHIADVVEYNHYLDKEQAKENYQGIEETDSTSFTPIEQRANRRLRLGDARVVMKAEARLGSIFDILLESQRLLIKESTRGSIDYELLASNLRSLLETSVTRGSLVSLPPFEPQAAATLVFGYEFPAGLPPTFVLLSPIEDHEGSLSFHLLAQRRRCTAGSATRLQGRFPSCIARRAARVSASRRRHVD